MNIELTERERDIYEQIVNFGLSPAEIAQKLFLSLSTVKTHIGSICQKYGFTSTTRTQQLIIDYYHKVLRGEEKMKNCMLCEFQKNEKCTEKESQYFNENVNEYMICRAFQEKKKAENSNEE